MLLSGTSQGLNYTFDSAVSARQFRLAVSLFDLEHNARLTSPTLAISTPTSTTGRIAWPELLPESGFVGELKDDHYEAIIEDGTASIFTAPHVLPFKFYLGDTNGDGDVDFGDMLAVSQHYGTTSGATYAQGDFNYDGAVDFTDLLVVANRYGTALAAMPAGSNTLAAGSATVDKITLNFSPPTDPATGVASTLFTGFRVFRSADGVTFSQISSDTDPDLQADGGLVYQWDDTNLTEGTKYWYRVRPFNTDATNGAPLGSWYMTNKVSSVTVLPMPTDPAATLDAAGVVHFSWVDHATTETSFEIQRAKNSTFTNGLTTLTGAANAASINDAPPLSGDVYFYRVRAVNAQQTSAFTQAVRAVSPTGNHAPVITGSPPTSMNVAPLSGFPQTLNLTATVRDFHPTSAEHPNDFQIFPSNPIFVQGMVADTLGADHTPVRSADIPLGFGYVYDDNSFHEWFHDVPGVNLSTQIAMPFSLNSVDTGTPVYRFNKPEEFLPINGRLFGDENRYDTVNGNFTLELHTNFTFKSNPQHPAFFNFNGDDDV